MVVNTLQTMLHGTDVRTVQQHKFIHLKNQQILQNAGQAS